ncbi:hypothetical protein [uncultured Clostridium sp.]|uniref:hypothetical protein n=1 Tax=uncultured Clostridium sp. TaxID=59620 RepID=UPI0026F3E675|nr:hypothetical protein [uncultured Clostridium sp.]
MKFIEVEKLEENIEDVKPIHEIAVASAVFECYNKALNDEDYLESYTSIDEFVEDNCKYLHGNLCPLSSPMIIKINDIPYVYSRGYVNKNNDITIIVEEINEDAEVFFLVKE